MISSGSESCSLSASLGIPVYSKLGTLNGVNECRNESIESWKRQTAERRNS